MLQPTLPADGLSSSYEATLKTLKVHVGEVALKRSKKVVSYYYAESTKDASLRQFGVILHDFPDSPQTWSSLGY